MHFEPQLSAEIVFQDFFAQPATNLTNSVPWIDVEGSGWRSGPVASQLALDGSGHIFSTSTSAGTAAGVQLVPIGPHGSMTASALMQLPTGVNEWIGMGFASSNQFLTAPASRSGPWIQVLGSGTLTLYSGPALDDAVPVPHAFTNSGGPVQVFLTYDAFDSTASMGTVAAGVTNLVLSRWPITNSTGAIAPRFLIVQMSTNLTTPTARWASATSVDWIPRPPPMLTLPVPIQQTNFVGPPGNANLDLIQSALNLVSNSTMGTEIRFTAGATYVITNASLTAGIPLVLSRATNVLVNGNGCKILITNPRIGFLGVNSCSNIIVTGFTVDHDPLPFTQGVVTHNYFNDSPKESAIEFRVDAGYPAPTNDNYLDPNASRWGMVMDPARPGRITNGAWTQVFYTNVVQAGASGVFKVFLTFGARAQGIKPGDLWCMISRWDGSMVFHTFQSGQVTYLSNTIYSAAGAAYSGSRCPLMNEVNDQIRFGPPPANASAPRRRTSNADGGLFVETRIGPWVQGCTFLGLSDDAANACIGPYIITNAPPYPTNMFGVFENTVRGGTPAKLAPFQAQVGDSMVFFNATNGVVFDRAAVTAVNQSDITFDHAIANVVPGTYIDNTMLINESLNTSAVYLENQFLDSAFHGIYCRANNMLIAHNTVGGMGKNAICAFPAITANFLNFFVPTNIVIMDNVLSDEGFSFEAVQNTIPSDQPAYAMIALLKADTVSDAVSSGFDISGIRILYNAFLDWRRAPLTLHNASDVHLIGNYFGPPATNDTLVPLSADVIADLWASDYANLLFSNNVNATTLADNATIDEDGTLVAPALNAFQLPVGPLLRIDRSGTSSVIGWVSPSPGFVLQQADDLTVGANAWTDIANQPVFSGNSNQITLVPGRTVTNQFYRARQR